MAGEKGSEGSGRGKGGQRVRRGVRVGRKREVRQE